MNIPEVLIIVGIVIVGAVAGYSLGFYRGFANGVLHQRLKAAVGRG